MDIPYGDKDQKGDYTLQQGDFVEFSIATDRRDKLQRATNIILLEETFEKTGEPRETVNGLLLYCLLKICIIYSNVYI